MHPGGGVVRVTLQGTGALTRVDIEETLMAPGEHEMVGAHAVCHRLTVVADAAA